MKLLNAGEVFATNTELGLQVDLQGWNSAHPLFAQLVEQVKPQTIIEVGSWKGASALHMAELTKDLGTKIYCCDTWLGEVSTNAAYNEQAEDAPIQYDVGKVYRQFLHNVVQSGHAERIFPIPHTSIAAARLLAKAGIQGDLVYIDADHGYEPAFLDLNFYAGLVAPGGILFGDDWNDFPGVRMAVSRFAYENSLKISVNGPAWVLQPS